MKWLLAAVLLMTSAQAENTRFWEQTTYLTLAKGTLEGLALRSDGSFRLGPRFDLVKETDSGYLWTIVEDAQKNLYAGGGSPGRVYKIPPNGPVSVLFETQELEIHALAIDRQGRIYAAAAPDGPVYRITPDGRSSVFYNPQTKYIWDLAFDSKENLYIATGDKGQIYRVTPTGEGKLFFSSEETHVRSLAIDRQDHLLAGTDGNGLILRILADGTPFVLYESPKKEVTALITDGEGTLYAAAVGDKPVVPGQPPPPAPAQPAPANQPPQQPPKAPPSPLTMNLVGGSEIYRITPDGSTQKIWISRNDIVYSLALGPRGRLLVGTGNDGKIYEVEPGGLHTVLAHSPSSQITALAAGNPDLLVAASNIGRLYRLRPEFASQGNFISEVFDAGKASQWGRLEWRQQLPPDTGIRFETRSGNSSNPALNWSAWKEAPVNGVEAASKSPRARFFQYKVVLSSTRGDKTPELAALRAAYLPNNVPPVIDDLQNTPPGFKFQQMTFGMNPQPRTINLPPLGAPPPPPAPPLRTQPPTQMTAEKGFVGVRWSAYDENDDTLTYSVYIRGEGEKNWKLLKENIADMFYTFDSGNWPDGTYVMKVVASDSQSNPPGEALSAGREGSLFDIDNTPPEIRNLQAAPQGKRLKISFRGVDSRSAVQGADYSIDGGAWRPALPVNRISDSRELDYQFESDEMGGGEHTVVVRVSDRFQNEAVAKTIVSAPQAAR